MVDKKSRELQRPSVVWNEKQLQLQINTFKENTGVLTKLLHMRNWGTRQGKVRPLRPYDMKRLKRVLCGASAVWMLGLGIFACDAWIARRFNIPTVQDYSGVIVSFFIPAVLLLMFIVPFKLPSATAYRVSGRMSDKAPPAISRPNTTYAQR